MGRTISVAATQMSCSWDTEANIARAEALVRQAAAEGADVVLLQELFETPYFCKEQSGEHFGLARPFAANALIERMSSLARTLGVVLPVSFFERAGNVYFNSLAMVDADGRVLGVYRKSHIPDGPGYQEKYYFSPGDTGFRVWDTRHGRLGVAVCWDQWFPECARAMTLMGAEVLFYPTAIGSEPQDAGLDSSGHWQRTMQGHAAANMIPLVASNRIGSERGDTCELRFYGGSFIAGPRGEIVVQAGRDEDAVIAAQFDLDGIQVMRTTWGVFRDRRPDLYRSLLSLDGHSAQ